MAVRSTRHLWMAVVVMTVVMRVSVLMLHFFMGVLVFVGLSQVKDDSSNHECAADPKEKTGSALSQRIGPCSADEGSESKDRTGACSAEMALG